MSSVPAEGRREGRRTPADEAWSLVAQLFFSNKARFFAIASEYELTPMQAHALRLLEPGRELPMSALADSLHCDASNVTGIVDRLEARGLIERRSADRDRRVKMLAVTPAGQELRDELQERLFTAPPSVAGLSLEDQRSLRDILRRALARGE
jgi:MarR family transcriptional regulator, organic hydroperoxide resistance regulator